MCKIFIIPGLKSDKLEDAKKLIKEATKIMAETEKDGVGYAAITNNGDIYGEKWLNPEDAWAIKANPEPDLPSYEELFLAQNFGDALTGLELEKEVKEVYSSYGTIDADSLRDTVAIMLHARKKTEGEICLKNTHPFYEVNDKDWPDTAIIHNGTIRNHEKLAKKLYSTCDSEVILHEYKQVAITYNPDGIDSLAKTLKGLYAVGALSSIQEKDNSGKLYNVPILDIFKSNKNLYCGYIKEIEAPVFSTDKMTLEKASKEAGLTLVGGYEVDDGKLIRIDATTGKRLGEIVEFEKSDMTNSWGGYEGSNSHSHRPNHHRPNHLPTTTNQHNRSNIVDATKTDIDTVKMDFEHNHKDLFDDDYIQINDITPEEQELINELYERKDIKSRALYLVQLSLGNVG